jgi:hypothetical protein
MQIQPSLPYVGYGLALFSIIDLLIYLFPLGFLNFNWEFNTFNYFVDSSPGTVIGFWLVLSQELVDSEARSKIENFFMGFSAWLALFLGIVYFLMIPMGVSAAYRLYSSNNAQIFFQQKNGIAKVEEVRKNIVTASDQDLAGLQKQIPNNPTLSPIQSPDKFRQSLIDQLESELKAIKSQTQDSLNNNQISILKRTIKSMVGALIVGFIFVKFWFQNVRRRKSIIKAIFSKIYDWH